MLKRLTLIRFLKACGIVFLINIVGCGTSRVVFVDTQADMVRLGNDVRGHIYYFKGGEWVRSRNKVNLPEGWVAGGIPQKEDEN